MWLEWFLPPARSMVWVVISALGMYTTILVLARWSGVRSFAEMSTFDIAVTIALGSLLSSTAAMKDPPLLQGMVAVATLYGLQLVVSRLRRRFRAAEAAVDNSPILLMGPGGEMRPENMRVARVTQEDLRSHLRAANVSDRRRVQAVVMEGTGAITVLQGANGQLSEDAWILTNVRDYSSERKSQRGDRSAAG